ncbi:MAG: outer membrane beta-barrel protein [Xanthomonadales bacterium]|nr:outer membrane beta-barrel protein [Xanthomonadales bacterium]
MKNLAKTTILLAFTGLAAPALAADMYLSGTLGYLDLGNSKNKGSFMTDFTTGEVTGVSPPLTIPEGAPVGWSTSFDSGMAYSIAFGWRMDAIRFEIEYAMSDSDISSHKGVTAAGIDLTNIDAGVLLTGNVGDLGVTVGELVADGQGSQDTSTFYLNAYYDFMHDSAFSPYIGAGVGYADTDVKFMPSGVDVINDSDSGYSYQFILGASYAFNDRIELFGDMRYRQTEDASVKSPLLSAGFDVENSDTLFNLGLRYSF